MKERIAVHSCHRPSYTAFPVSPYWYPTPACLLPPISSASWKLWVCLWRHHAPDMAFLIDRNVLNGWVVIEKLRIGDPMLLKFRDVFAFSKQLPLSRSFVLQVPPIFRAQYLPNCPACSSTRLNQAALLREPVSHRTKHKWLLFQNRLHNTHLDTG